MAGYAGKHHVLIRIMHWVMALLILGMIGCGWYMADLPKDDPLKGQLVGLHKSFGTLLLIMFFVRVLCRIVVTVPPLPETIPLIERALARVGHMMLYVFIGIVPLSGYAMSNMHGYEVSLFGLAMPKLFPTNKDLAGLVHEAHELLPYALLVIVILHVSAVIRHRFFDKPGNDVLGRML